MDSPLKVKVSGSFTCKYCSNTIKSLDDVSNHDCFYQKVYMDDNNVLFVVNENSSSNDVLPGKSQEDLPEVDDDEEKYGKEEKKESTKQTAVWTKNATLALLSLYETNKNMLENPKKKTKIWMALSTGLHDLNIKMSVDQVRWRMNYLMKKYKECTDNNSKSGRSTMTFEFFNEMEEIFGFKKNATAIYTISSNLLSKTNKNSITETNVQPYKKVKSDHLDHPSGNTSKDISRETKENVHTKVLHNKNLNKSQTKDDVGKLWLEYMHKEEKRREDRYDTAIKTKKEILKLKKYNLEMRDKEIEAKKTIALNKIKSKERRHEILEIEKLKYSLLKRLLNNKENLTVNSDSD